MNDIYVKLPFPPILVSAEGVGLPSGMGFIGLSMPEANMSGGIISPPFLSLLFHDLSKLTTHTVNINIQPHIRKTRANIFIYKNNMQKTIKQQHPSIMSDAYIELL